MTDHLSEFEISGQDDTIVVRLRTSEAPKPAAQRALLLTFAGERQAALANEPYNLPENQTE